LIDRPKTSYSTYTSSVLDLVSQVRDATLMSVYLDVGNPKGAGFWNEGYVAAGGQQEILQQAAEKIRQRK
jgi:hypothetical protein